MKPPTMLSRVAAFDLDKATQHRISVTLPDSLVRDITAALPVPGILNWLLQHAANNFHIWLQNSQLYGPYPTTDRIMSAIINGSAFQRTAVAVAVKAGPIQDDGLGTDAVRHGTTKTADTASSPSSGKQSRTRRPSGKGRANKRASTGATTST